MNIKKKNATKLKRSKNIKIVRLTMQIKINPKARIESKLQNIVLASDALNRFYGLSQRTIPKQVYV